MAKKPVSIEHVSASITRWKSRLKRAMTMIDKLEKQRKRIEKAAAKPQSVPASVLVAAVRTVVKPDEPKPLAKPATEIDTSIPAFLQRKALDPVAEQIKAEQEATKRTKARGRIERMKAKQRGDLEKMPRTGRAALDAIRNG